MSDALAPTQLTAEQSAGPAGKQVTTADDVLAEKAVGPATVPIEEAGPDTTGFSDLAPEKQPKEVKDPDTTGFADPAPAKAAPSANEA